VRFAALRARWYKGYLVGGSLMMAGDNMEHAITYWAMWQYFHSPLLAGFAVIAHWAPHLLFSIQIGGLADRFDCRRIIQFSGLLFMTVSVIWGVLLATGTLQPWHVVLLLLGHGIASAFWGPADQLMLYDMVGEKDLPSAVRLMATGITLGQLVGPAFGAILIFAVGPAIGMFINIAMYLPFWIYLLIVPITGHVRDSTPRPRVRLRDVADVLREVPKYPSILVAMILQGAVGLFIGVALLPLFPEFGELLGESESGPGYAVLVAAMSAGAVIGGLTTEAVGRIRASTRLAIVATIVFAGSVLVFAVSRSFWLSVLALLVAGVGNIVSSSMSTTLVQLEAPPERRGRFIGAFGITANGFRLGSGVLIGILGGLVGASGAVAIDAVALLLVAVALLAVVLVVRRRRPSIEPDRSVDVENPTAAAAGPEADAAT
jgi:MFS family permease